MIIIEESKNQRIEGSEVLVPSFAMAKSGHSVHTLYCSLAAEISEFTGKEW